MLVNRFFWVLLLTSSVICQISNGSQITENDEECVLSTELKNEIESYFPLVQELINATMNGDFKGSTFKDMSEFVDKFNGRISGSEVLEDSIDYMINKAINHNFENAHGEEVKVPKWVRGLESATVIQPHERDLRILGLGYSVGTPREGILAKVIVVKTFDELEKKAGLAKGKIVVFNQDFDGYYTAADYRKYGANKAAEVGAIAVLTRSVTPFSIYSPHTGNVKYAANVTKIPAACITVEDAVLLQKMQDKGDTIKIHLKMEAQNLPNTTSRNVIFDIKGREQPEKLVIMSGHMDCWDINDGAQDDGGGVFVTWEALALLKSLGLRARRTMRGILWTAEEFGLVGARSYAEKYSNDTDNLIFVMEADEGTFSPTGLNYAGDSQGACILKTILQSLQPLNATKLRQSKTVGSDIGIFLPHGIPGADTMEKIDAVAMDKNTAVIAAVMFIVADLSIDLPRKNVDGNNTK